jgi:hypothetical protein
VQPPNYIGFRYEGRLQSVHHIDSFKIVHNLATDNPLWPENPVDWSDAGDKRHDPKRS